MRFYLSVLLILGTAACSVVPDMEVKPPPPVSREVAPPVRAKDMISADFLLENTRENKVLASVDDEKILASELLQVSYMANPRKVKEIVDNLVLYVLVRKEAERLNVRVNEGAMELLLEKLIQDQQGRVAIKVDENLKLEDFIDEEYNMTMKEYKTIVRKTAVFHLLLERLVRYHELLVKRLMVGVLVARDRKKALDMVKKLRAGANFKTVSLNNTLETTGIRAEIWPPLPADMDNPLIKEALALGKGGVSDPIEVKLGEEKIFRIIKLIGIVEPVTGTYEELSGEVEASLKAQPVIFPELIPYWRDSLKARYKIKSMF